ncbi:hypothetical protein AArcMg_2891 [Natrarchaeobaculum sulfurireducens]|uniref:Uncharacterized protein n=1 Tax=Natrarchaeobaculum sulfurireducens TaxID=2044521 RepID=A0A346PTN5_9EURY|nr:hypothetical protein AArcMg_2891 [Natrarchaeobaculum sulfurireducens]
MVLVVVLGDHRDSETEFLEVDVVAIVEYDAVFFEPREPILNRRLGNAGVCCDIVRAVGSYSNNCTESHTDRRSSWRAGTH